MAIQSKPTQRMKIFGMKWLACLISFASASGSLYGQGVVASPYTVTTFAGQAGSSGAANGTGAVARFSSPAGIAVDVTGTVYIADTFGPSIRKITPDGLVTTFAGKAGNDGTADGTGEVARFSRPRGLAIDGSGNLYVSDQTSFTIRKISPAGEVTTFAGLGGVGGSTDGTGAAARFSDPDGLALDATGNLYVADGANHTIRKITPAGVVSTFAGVAGLRGSVNGPPDVARFNDPTGLAIDNLGNLYVTDSGNYTVRKISPAGIVTTVAGQLAYGYIDGVGEAARFWEPRGLAIDAGGNLYVTDAVVHVIRRIDPAGVVSTLAGGLNQGSADGIGTAARFGYPRAIAVDASGVLYITDTQNHTIRRAAGPASINTHPHSATVELGQNATLSVTLNGGSGATYQWAKNGVALPGAVASILLLGPITREDAGTYRVVVTTSEGGVTTSNAAVLTVNGPPFFTGQPAPVAVVAGSDIAFGDIAAGTPAPSFQWFKSGAPIAGAVDASFTLSRATAADAGDYALKTTNSYGTITSTPFTVTVTPTVVFSTFAGRAMIGATDGGVRVARFNFPNAATVDSAGNVFVADGGNHVIRKITSNGMVSTVAGLSGAWGNADGVGELARFHRPEGIAVDGEGNLYVSDSFTVRKITPDGVVTTLAGQANQFGAQDGTGGAARFSTLTGLAVDGAGNIYVADSGNHTMRKITPVGVVTTVAGAAGVAGSTDGVLSVARFNYPTGVTVDSTGNIYVADLGNATIRVITSGGIVRTLAGRTGQRGVEDGPGGTALFESPWGLTLDVAGDIFVSDVLNHTVRKVTSAGMVSTVAGTRRVSGYADGIGGVARLDTPRGVIADADGVLYIVDSANHAVRRLSPAGVMSTLAGPPLPAVSLPGADGFSIDAIFADPGDVAVDELDNVYVADTGNHSIRKITPLGAVSTLAGRSREFGHVDGTGSVARFNQPSGIAVDATGAVYVADSANHAIRKISSDGTVVTLAGLGGTSGYSDGSGSAARFYLPSSVAVDATGNVYVADTGNSAIRKITPHGVVTTFAGRAAGGFFDGIGSADGIGTQARFNAPRGLAMDGLGNIYVADTNSNLIRKISPAAVVTTLAGQSNISGNNGHADGLGGAAKFWHPTALAVDDVGNVYVADAGNSTIRRITPDGMVSTLGGTPQAQANVDAAGMAARFSFASGIAITRSGTLYIADSGNDTIRKGVLSRSWGVAPEHTAVPPGGRFVIRAPSYDLTAEIEWHFNGRAIGTGETLVIEGIQPDLTGLYAAVQGGDAGTTSEPAILGIASRAKLVGLGTEVGSNIVHPNRNVYDQVLLQGSAATLTADPGEVTRISFVDLTDDIVQVEFSGAGALTVVLENFSGPALAANYNQPDVAYMKGHAGIVITGADETTHVAVFSVGSANSVNQGLFRSNVTYDGVADIAYLAIMSANGKFGGIRAGNVNFFATKGFTGIYAPEVQFRGPVFVGEINAFDSASPVLVIGAVTDVRVTGGDLQQPNNRPVRVAGFTQLQFTAGSSSHGAIWPARANQGRLEYGGVDVTHLAVNTML